MKSSPYIHKCFIKVEVYTVLVHIKAFLNVISLFVHPKLPRHLMNDLQFKALRSHEDTDVHKKSNKTAACTNKIEVNPT